MMLMLITVLNMPTVAVAVVRVRGVARAREECPAGHSGHVAHVQDPYSSPQVALPLLVEVFRGHRAVRRARRAPRRPSLCTTQALRIWARGVQRHPPRLPTTHSRWLRRAHTQFLFSVNIYTFLLLNNIYLFL